MVSSKLHSPLTGFFFSLYLCVSLLLLLLLLRLDFSQGENTRSCGSGSTFKSLSLYALLFCVLGVSMRDTVPTSFPHSFPFIFFF